MCKAKIIRMTGFFGIVFASLFLLQSPLFVQDSSAASQTFTFSSFSNTTISTADSLGFFVKYIKAEISGIDTTTAASSCNYIRLRFDGSTNYFKTFYVSGSFHYVDYYDYSSVDVSSLLVSTVIPSTWCTSYVSSYSLTITLSDSPLFSSSSGSLSITENGTFDVTNYAEAVVDVPSSDGSNYHQDLVDLKQAIYTGVAVLLVIYFFWMIYRIIIINTRR